MHIDDNECTVTISRKRYAELVIAERDADRLKTIIRDCADNYKALGVEDLKILRNLLCWEEEEE